MEMLQHQDTYGPDLANKIMAQGRYAVRVVNRWVLGWPHRVQALVETHVYWACLMAHINDEKDILSDEPTMRHLSEREILELHGVQQCPPALKEIAQ